MTWIANATIDHIDADAENDEVLVRVSADASHLGPGDTPDVTSNTEGNIRKIEVIFHCEKDPGLRVGERLYISGHFTATSEPQLPSTHENPPGTGDTQMDSPVEDDQVTVTEPTDEPAVPEQPTEPVEPEPVVVPEPAGDPEPIVTDVPVDPTPAGGTTSDPGQPPTSTDGSPISEATETEISTLPSSEGSGTDSLLGSSTTSSSSDSLPDSPLASDPVAPPIAEVSAPDELAVDADPDLV